MGTALKVRMPGAGYWEAGPGTLGGGDCGEATAVASLPASVPVMVDVTNCVAPGTGVALQARVPGNI